MNRTLLISLFLFLATSPFARAEEFHTITVDGRSVEVTVKHELPGGARVVQTQASYGYIDRQGNRTEIPEGEYIHLCRFREGLAAVNVDFPGNGGWMPQRWGYIDQEGRMAIPPKFQHAEDFSEGLAAVNIGSCRDERADDLDGPPMYDTKGRCRVHPITSDGKWGFIDQQGKLVIPAEYIRVSKFSEGLALVAKETDETDELGYRKEICGLIDRSGKFVFEVPFWFWEDKFQEGLFR